MSAADLPDDLFTEIQGAFRKAPVLLVGSGFSCGYGLPGMGALAEHLANTVDGVLTTDEAQMKPLKNHFDFILNTVSAVHDLNSFLDLLKVEGKMLLVGIPPEDHKVAAEKLISKRRSIVGSMIGGIQETQEMLDYCAKHSIMSDVEVIPMNYINTAYDRILKSDVKYRFVIDMATL